MIRKQIVLPASRDQVWEALTDPRELERWFANDVVLELRPGGAASFRWGNGESRHATVTEVEPERGASRGSRWDDEGEVEFTLEDDAERPPASRSSRPRRRLVDRASTLPARALAYALTCRKRRDAEPRLLGARRPEPPACARLPRGERDRDRDRAHGRAPDHEAGGREAPGRETSAAPGWSRRSAPGRENALPAHRRPGPSGTRSKGPTPSRRHLEGRRAAARRMGLYETIRATCPSSSRRSASRRSRCRTSSPQFARRTTTVKLARRRLVPASARTSPTTAPSTTRSGFPGSRPPAPGRLRPLSPSKHLDRAPTCSRAARPGRPPIATTGAGRSSPRRSTWRCGLSRPLPRRGRRACRASPLNFVRHRPAPRLPRGAGSSPHLALPELQLRRPNGPTSSLASLAAPEQRRGCRPQGGRPRHGGRQPARRRALPASRRGLPRRLDRGPRCHPRDRCSAQAPPRPDHVGRTDPLIRRRPRRSPSRPNCLNCKPSRFELARAPVRGSATAAPKREIALYGGGQFEARRRAGGRSSCSPWARSTPQGSNDVAPGGYDSATPRSPASQLSPSTPARLRSVSAAQVGARISSDAQAARHTARR